MPRENLDNGSPDIVFFCETNRWPRDVGAVACQHGFGRISEDVISLPGGFCNDNWEKQETPENRLSNPWYAWLAKLPRRRTCPAYGR